MANELTAEIALNRWSYDPETGDLKWKISIGKGVAGERAGSHHKADGYGRLKYRQKSYQQHRVIWLMMTGAWPADLVDHIDGDKLNNRWGNLRAASPAVNSQNRKRADRGSASGVLGVTEPRRGRWCASITFEGKSIYLGTFATSGEAYDVYVKAKRQMHPGCTL